MSKIIEKLLQNHGDNYVFPFFWQHGETEEVLRQYMKVINEDNIRSVCVESRPHPDFCGPKWWHDMDVILNEAKKRNMKVWILDDSHFPTGYANGAIDSKPENLCRQSICCRIYDLSEQKHLHIDSNDLLHPKPFVKTEIEHFIIQEPFRQFHDDKLLSLYAVEFDDENFKNTNKFIDLIPLIKEDTLDWDAPTETAGKWKVYALHLSRNMGYHRSYINMLNSISCHVLIESVYEPHWNHYKEFFGNTIEGFFSDEPELGNGHIYEFEDEFGKPDLDYPWSDEVENELKKVLKSIPLIGLLWETEADPDLTAQVRYAYMDVITKLVKKDFSYQIGNWCRSHNVKYIGHMIEDNNHHSKTGCSLGHYFRGLSGQDMAGIDDIGGQVLPQGEHVTYNRGVFDRREGEFYHFLLGKLASSAASIEPLKKGNSMCEIFGAYGWSEGLRLEKYLVDHFLVRGINHFVPHAFSPKEFPDPDCPPHFYANGNNPEYRHFGYLMSYINRVCELISNGRHVSPVAVLYHGEGQWTGKFMKDDEIGCLLTENQIEYDIIPQDVFITSSEFNKSISDGFLTVNTQKYSTLIVPYTEYITKEFIDDIPNMKKAGIPVIFVNEYPKGICNFDSTKDIDVIDSIKQNASILKKDEIIDFLKKKNSNSIDLEFCPSNVYLRFIHYIHDKEKTSIYLIVNEGKDIYRGKVNFSFLQESSSSSSYSSHSSHYIYDAWNNQIIDAEIEGNSLNVTIEPLKSLIVVFDNNCQSEDSIKRNKICYSMIDEINKSKEVIEIDNNKWKRSTCRSIDYPNFVNEKVICLPDTLDTEDPEFSGFVRYENSFHFQKENSTNDNKHLILCITDAYEGVEVFINNSNLGIQIVPCFVYDISDFVVDGENKIRIEVATTLEREMYKIPQKIGGPKPVPKDPSGINGEVKIVKL